MNKELDSLIVNNESNKTQPIDIKKKRNNINNDINIIDKKVNIEEEEEGIFLFEF